MDATATERASLVSLSMGAQRGLILAAEHPGRVTGSVFICPAVPLAGPLRARTLTPWEAEIDDPQGWERYTRHAWLQDYRGFLEFFFSQMFNEPHSTKPIEDCVGWGLETTAETLIATQEAEGLDEAPRAAVRAAIESPVLVIQGTRRRDHRPGPRHRPRRGDRRRAGADGGLRPRPARPRSRRGQPPPARLRRPAAARADLAPRPRPPQARALRLLPHRPRPRPARRGDRRGAAQAPSRPGDRLARPASRHARARGPRRAHPPAQRAPRQRVDAHRERVGRARPALLPGHPPHGRDPARQLHGLRGPRPRGALRRLDRGRGLGARLLPAREPGPQARRLRLAHRLRRLAADGGRRRPRGLPDHGLQRRDDRAHRALPAAARPRRVRRLPGRHRPRRASARGSPASASGRRSTTTSRATSPASTRATSATAPRSATATTSASASSPSAARASAATSCAASSPPSPRPRSASPTCG